MIIVAYEKVGCKFAFYLSKIKKNSVIRSIFRIHSFHLSLQTLL